MTTHPPAFPLIDETCLTRLGVMVVQGPHQAHLTPGDLSRALADLDELDCEVAHVKGVWLTRKQAAALETAWLMADLVAEADRLRGQLDRARDFAARLEADGARLTAERDGARGMRVIATRAFETTRRVLQEASGLPDDIDDPDCRDEMVLALRPRAEKAEAEVARLREGIEALSDEMQSDTCPACHAFYADEGSTTWGCDHTEGMQHAGDMLRALLAEGGE